MKRQEPFFPKAAKGADILLAGGGIASLLALFYIFYRYGWAGERQFASPMGAVFYYAPPMFLAALLFISLKLKPRYKITFALFCLILTTSAYGLEIYLYSSHPESRARSNDEIAQLAKQSGVQFDTRSESQVIADLRRGGIAAVPQIVLPTFEKEHDEVKPVINLDGVDVMALAGVAGRVTVVCNQNGEYLTYKSDERGFHNPAGIWSNVDSNIVAVGNSFTMGYCVPSGKNFVALIREDRPATLNLGMAGAGPLQILAVLREYLPLLKPKSVLWFYFEGNNLSELQKEKQSGLLMRYLQDGFNQRLLRRQSELDRALTDYLENTGTRDVKESLRQANNRHDRWIGIIKLSALRQRSGLIYGEDAQETDLQGATMNLLREILAQAKSDVSARGGRLYFIYLPSWERYALKNPGLQAGQRTRILRYADDLGLPIIDLHPAFQAQSDPLSLFPFHGPGHYNEKGHRLVAEEVLKTLRRNDLAAPEGMTVG